MAIDRSAYGDHDTFLRAVDPLSKSLTRLIESGYAARLADTEGRAEPSADSSAMTELAEQPSLSGEWDDTPIDTAHTHIGLLLTAGEDAMRTFASVIVAEQTPVYSYIPVARFGIECLALAYWLGEPRIGSKERVRRSLNERILSAYEQTRLPCGLNPEPSRQARLLEATALGYHKTKSKRGRLTCFAPEPPTITRHIQRVLEDEEVGTAMYSYMSAISHGTIWGLIERAETPPEPWAGPVVTAALTISSTNIAGMAVALLLAHLNAFGAYLEHMGWQPSDWATARDYAAKVVAGYVGMDEPRVEDHPRRAAAGGLWLP